MESIEIGAHKFGVEEIDGEKYVLGCVIDGVQLPDPKDLPAGYFVMINSSASLEVKAEAEPA